MSLKTPERMCTICNIRQRHFVVASKYSYIIRIFEYLRDRIFESYFSIESQPYSVMHASACSLVINLL